MKQNGAISMTEHPRQAGYFSDDDLHPRQQMQKSNEVENTAENKALTERINEKSRDYLDRWRPLERKAMQRTDTGIAQRKGQALGVAATDINAEYGRVGKQAQAVNANRGVALGSGRQVVGTEGGLALTGSAAKSVGLTTAAAGVDDAQKSAEMGIVQHGQKLDAENLAEAKEIARIAQDRAVADAQAKSRFRARRIGLVTGGASMALGAYAGGK